MSAEEDTIYSRARKRIEEKARLEEAKRQEELVWSKDSSILAIKDAELGFKIVRCEDDVDIGDITSNATFRAAVLVLGKYRKSMVPSGDVVDVEPSQIIRPIKLVGTGLVPQSVYQWLFDNYPPEGASDDDEAYSEKGGRKSWTLSQSVERAGSAKRGRASSKVAESDDDTAGSEDDSAGDDDDDDEDSLKSSPKGKKTRASQGSAASPKPTKVPKLPKEPKVKVPKPPKPPKVPKAKKAAPTKKPRKETHPFVEKPEILFGESNELDPRSHKEAMRAVNTDNVELFRKVVNSPAHFPWIRASLGPESPGVDEVTTPLSKIVRQWKFSLIEVLIESPLKFPHRLNLNAGQAFGTNFGFSQAQDLPITSVVDGNIVVWDSNKVKEFSDGVALINSSQLHRQGSGQARFQTFGRRVRNVAAGRGGRELDNAFLGEFSNEGEEWFSMVMETMGEGLLTKAKFQQLSDALLKSCKTPAEESAMLIALKSTLQSKTTEVLRTGDAAWALELWTEVSSKDTSGLNGAFHLAALNSATTALPESKQPRASILKKGQNNITPLHLACLNPSSIPLKLMLKEVGDVPVLLQDSEGHDLWHYAVMNPSTCALIALQEHGVAFSPPLSSNTLSPLHFAAVRNRHEHIALLLKENAVARLGVLHQFGNRFELQNPWFTAAISGSTDALRAMLDAVGPDAKKAMLKSVRKGTGLTALHLATLNGHLSTVKFLVENKAQIDCRDKHKRTPLLLASKGGFLDIMSYLASEGAALFASDSSGNMAIHYACAFGHLEILQYLVKRCSGPQNVKSIINLETSWRMTPIGLALLCGFSSTCGRYLLGLKEQFGSCTAVSTACNEEDEVSTEVEDVSVNINFRDKDYDTLLLRFARTLDYSNIPQVAANIKFLLALGADPTLEDPKGENIVHIIARSTAATDFKAFLAHYLADLLSIRNMAMAPDVATDNGLAGLAAALAGAGQGVPNMFGTNPALFGQTGASFTAEGDDEDDEKEESENDEENDDDDEEDDCSEEGEGEDGGEESGEDTQGNVSPPKVVENAPAFQILSEPPRPLWGIGAGLANRPSDNTSTVKDVWTQHELLKPLKDRFPRPHSVNQLRYAIDRSAQHNKKQQETVWFKSVEAEISLVEKLLTNELQRSSDSILLKLVLNSVSDPNALLNKMSTEEICPVLAALQASNVQFVELLLRNGASASVSDKNGNNLLHHIFSNKSILSGPTLDMLRTVVIPSTNVTESCSQVNRDGMTPLHVLFANIVATAPQTIAPEISTGVIDLLNLIVAKADQSVLKTPVDRKRLPTDEEIAALRAQPEPQLRRFGHTHNADTKPFTGVTNQTPDPRPPCFPHVMQVPVSKKTSTLGEEFTVDKSKLPPLPLIPEVEYHYCGGWTIVHFLASSPLPSTVSFGDRRSPFIKDLIRKVLAVSDRDSILTACDVFGRTPLLVALSVQNEGGFSLVCESEGALHKPDHNGVSPIMLASQLPSLNIFFALLEKVNPTTLTSRDTWGRSVLHRVASVRNLEAIHRLLSKRIFNLDVADRDGVRPLHFALNNASGDSFSQLHAELALIAAGADVDTVDNHNRTVLHHCFFNATGTLRGDPIEAVGTILPFVKDLPRILSMQETLIGGHTPVSLAVLSKSLSTCLLLAARGSPMDVTDKHGNTPLALAIRSGLIDFAIAVLQLGRDRVKPDVFVCTVERSEPDPNQPGKLIEHITKATACAYAMKRGWNGLVYMLLEAGYSRRQAISDALSLPAYQFVEGLLSKIPQQQWGEVLRGYDASGRTLLHSVASMPVSTQEDISKACALLQQLATVAGIPVDSRDNLGNTPAHAANGNLHVLLTLKNLGADMNAVSAKNLSPLSYFLGKSPFSLTDVLRKDLVAAFETLGCSADFLVEITPGKIITATAAAVERNDLKTLVVLIEHGASLARADTDDCTLLMHSVKAGKVDIVTLLMKCGRDIALNHRSKSSGTNALHLATLGNRADLVEVLLEGKNIEVDASDVNKRTPLHLVVRTTSFGSYLNIRILRALLRAGADPHKKDVDGFSPLEYAHAMTNKAMLDVMTTEFGIASTSLTLTRNTSVIPTSKWNQAHEPVDFDADVASALNDHDTQTTTHAECIVEAVDPVYFKSVKGASPATIKVWNSLDAVMTKVDVSYGSWGLNMFYRLQVLHDVFRNVWILWTRWGRIGEDGQYQATPFPRTADAEKEFFNIFKSKSSNEWAHRKDFVKTKGKYMYHPIKTGKVVSGDTLLQPWGDVEFSTPASALPEVLSQLLRELCDVTTLTQAYNLTGVASTSWPLGKVSNEVLDVAISILGQMKGVFEQLQFVTANHKTSPDGQSLSSAELTNELQTLREKIAELANNYYELVPHADFSNDRIAPPVSMEDLQQLWNRVSSMRELQISARLIIASRYACTKYKLNALDYLLRALDIDVEQLRPPSEGHDGAFNTAEAEYCAINRYVRNSCSDPIFAIFRVQRRAEAEKFIHFCSAENITNRKLLFHGSGSSNVLPILKEGLRIAPPEAPATGYMFGKGIYFADMASKSMNYAHRQGDSAFMFVCEVAVGETYNRVGAEYVEKLPSGKHCTKGIGARAPNPNEDIIMNNGVVIPIGAVVETKLSSEDLNQLCGPLPPNSRVSLAANEYIVYNTAQVRIRYVIQFKDEKKSKK